MAAKQLTRYTPIHAWEVADYRGKLGPTDVVVTATDTSVALKICGENVSARIVLDRASAAELARVIAQCAKESEAAALAGAA